MQMRSPLLNIVKGAFRHVRQDEWRARNDLHQRLCFSHHATFAEMQRANDPGYWRIDDPVPI